MVSTHSVEEPNGAQFGGIVASQNDRMLPVRVSEEQYRTLFTASRIPFFVLSSEPQDFIFIEVNDAYLAVTGTTPRTRYDIPRPGALEFAAGQDIIYADSKRMQQVFWNLLKNASKFTPERGQIVVRSRNESGLILVDVGDTGMGFEAAE